MPRFHPLQPNPEAVPPEEVRLTELRVEPWPDGRRIRLHARLTPFQSPPNLEAVLNDPKGNIIASAYIVENIDFDLVITMHIRGPVDYDRYSVMARVIYENLGTVHEMKTYFTMPPNGV